MKNFDTPLHVRGQALFLDDLPVPAGLLYAAALFSPTAHGRIKRFDVRVAEESPGVAAVLTFRDIPGENEIGGIIRDEPLLAEEKVHFAGQPVALILASDKTAAARAAKKIELEIGFYKNSKKKSKWER